MDPGRVDRRSSERRAFAIVTGNVRRIHESVALMLDRDVAMGKDAQVTADGSAFGELGMIRPAYEFAYRDQCRGKQQGVGSGKTELDRHGRILQAGRVARTALAVNESKAPGVMPVNVARACKPATLTYKTACRANRYYSSRKAWEEV